MSILFLIISGLLFIIAMAWLHTCINYEQALDKQLVPLMFIASGIFAIAGVLA